MLFLLLSLMLSLSTIDIKSALNTTFFTNNLYRKCSVIITHSYKENVNLFKYMKSIITFPTSIFTVVTSKVVCDVVSL